MAAGRLDRFRASIVADELVDASTEGGPRGRGSCSWHGSRGWAVGSRPPGHCAVARPPSSSGLIPRSSPSVMPSSSADVGCSVGSSRHGSIAGMGCIRWRTRGELSLVDERARAILAAGVPRHWPRPVRMLMRAVDSRAVQGRPARPRGDVVGDGGRAGRRESGASPETRSGCCGRVGGAARLRCERRDGRSAQLVAEDGGHWEVVRSTDLTCDPVTGALIGVRVPRAWWLMPVRWWRDHPVTGSTERSQAASAAYRPSAELRRLVSLRDGHCRFPGCSVTIRQCDLDHVRPWPTGLTTQGNLMAFVVGIIDSSSHRAGRSGSFPTPEWVD